MNREWLGALVVALLLITAFSRWRSTPDKGDYRPVSRGFPRLHLYKGADDVDASLDVHDHAGHSAGRLVLDDGWVYEPKDGSIKGTYTSDLYLIEKRWDLGGFGGYRNASDSQVDAFTVGFRVSPVRLLYGTTAPDIVLAKDWVGAGLSVYLPPELVGRTASHFGIGAWYGGSFAGSHSGPAWTYGLSFSTNN